MNYFKWQKLELTISWTQLSFSQHKIIIIIIMIIINRIIMKT